MISKKREGMIQEERQGTEAARFNALIQNLGDLVTLHDATGVILYATPSTARVLGYPEEQLIGMNGFSLIHPDDLTHSKLAFARVLNIVNRGEPTEYRVRCADGEWVDVETVGTNLLNDPAIGGIILTSRIITERKRHERQLEAITAVAAALRTAPSRARLLPIILEELIHVLSVDGAALVLRGETADQLAVSLGRGRCEDRFGLAEQVRSQFMQQVVRTGESYRSADVYSDLVFPAQPSQSEPARRVTVACVPLRAREQTIGAIWIEKDCQSSEGGCAISDEQVQLLRAIAEMSGNAIHRATLAEQTELRLHRLMVLQAIDLTISRGGGLQLSLDLLLGEITSRLRIDAADVLVIDADSNEPRRVASRGFTTDFLARSDACTGPDWAGRALLERRIVHVEGLTRRKLPPEVRPIMEAEGFVSYYGLPLISGGKILGVLELFQRGALANDREWIDYLDGLAAHVAFAIEKETLVQDLQRSDKELTRAADEIIEGWNRALTARGHEMPGGAVRLSEMAVRLGKLIGLYPCQLTRLRRGALLHDVGNLALPDSLLLKEDSLTAEEWEIIRTHPLHAYDLMSAIPELRKAIDIPFCHHERWDGSGYPRGLKGDEIPIAVQVFSVVDVYDALTSNRPYRKAWPVEKAIEYVSGEAGRSLSPAIVETFLKDLPAIVNGGE